MPLLVPYIWREPAVVHRFAELASPRLAFTNSSQSARETNTIHQGLLTGVNRLPKSIVNANFKSAGRNFS